MDLKTALASGRRVAYLGGDYYTKQEIEDLISDGQFGLASLTSEDWEVEAVSVVRLSETDFKTVWDEVAAEFTSVKTFENSVLAKKLLTRFVSGYKVG